MHARPKFAWTCGICEIEWDSEQDAEWCCSPQCEELTLPTAAKEMQDKIVKDVLQLM